MEALEILRKAYDEFDVSLLRRAVKMGANVNQEDKYGESWYEDSVYDRGCEIYNGEVDPVEMKARMIDFSRELVANGLNLNHYSYDCGNFVTTFQQVARWSHNPELLEYLLQSGMNPNIITDKDWRSPYDDLHGDIFGEECCGYDDCASYLYNVCRLSVAYGAKPIVLLRPEGNPSMTAICDLGMKLDAGEISKLDMKTIIQRGLSHECTFFSRFEYGYDFYYNPERYEERVISALDVIIEKTGIDCIDNDCLYDCVDGQLVNVMEYLLNKGADPNVNCFSKPYSWVKSSALYELDIRGKYYDPQKASMMNELLKNSGAIIK